MQSYLDVLRMIELCGTMQTNRTGVRTKAAFGWHWWHDMRDGFPLLTTKKLPFRWIVEELRWMLRGSTDANELKEYGVHTWNAWATAEQCAKFGRPAGQLGPTYGELLRDFDDGVSTGNGVDQLAQLIGLIQKEPDSRRMIVTFWHPFLSRCVAVPPCQTSFQIKCLGNKMSMAVTSRSSDAFVGLPFDIAHYGLLLELLACVTGYVAHELLFHMADVHVYENHLDLMRKQLKREPRELPRLKLAADLCGSGLTGLLTWSQGRLFGAQMPELIGYTPDEPIPAQVVV